jgi:hypothetical protein
MPVRNDERSLMGPFVRRISNKPWLLLVPRQGLWMPAVFGPYPATLLRNCAAGKRENEEGADEDKGEAAAEL